VRLNRLGIRARITGGSLLFAILISIVAGIIIRNQVVHIIYDGEVSVLRSIAAPYRTALTTEPTPELDPPGHEQEAAVVDPQGVVEINTLQRALRPQLQDLISRDTDTRTVVANGVHYLVSVSTVKTAQGTWSIVAARNSDAQSSVLNSITVLLIVALAIINLGFGAASWFIGGAALSPVNRLRRSASELASRPGDELLPVGPADDEITQLARTLNELISELRASADRERQIVSDASHELRTPLAILQTKLELAQSQAGTLKQMRTEVASAQQTLQRLSALATSLLELSRIDAQSARGSATVDELATELADAADRGRLRVGAGEVVIDFAVDLPGSVRAVAISTHDFGRLCDNLVNNSLAARPDSGRIELALRGMPHGVQLTVDDEAGGMDEAFVPHAFDRFARDAERSADSTGAGLGLAIVSAIVSVAGGKVAIVNTPGTGLRVEIALPFAHSDTPAVKRGD
jgi:two-component system, OmpR family, sensor kinase